MQLGYNTNGFGFHRLEEATDIIAELGYRCIALTLDVHHLDPFKSSANDVANFKARIERHGLSCVIETGARFLLDPRRKHRPTLLDTNPGPRLELMERAMQIAATLGASCVSYWSGARPVEPVRGGDGELFKRLAGHVVRLEERAAALGVALAIEPEPGFLVESMADYERLCGLVGRELGLTLDIGHLRCVEAAPERELITRYANVLRNVQLDDMKAGVHRHLPFGEGEVDWTGVFNAFAHIEYHGPACVELSESSRDAVNVARQSMDFLRSQIAKAAQSRGQPGVVR